MLALIIMLVNLHVRSRALILNASVLVFVVLCTLIHLYKGFFMFFFVFI